MNKNFIKITAILIIAVILQSVVVKGAGSSVKEIVDELRKKVTSEQTYKFGDESKFVLNDEQAVLLRCSENPADINSVLICLTSDSMKTNSSGQDLSKKLFIYLIQKGEAKGGGSPATNSGTIRGVGKAVAISKWTLKDGQLQGLFILTDNKKIATEKFMELIKNGFISDSGNWTDYVDYNSMRLTPDEQVEGFVRMWRKLNLISLILTWFRS